MKPTLLSVLPAVLVVAACTNFEVTNPNGVDLASLTQSPTAAKLASAATGIFQSSRYDVTSYIWRTGSMGREGANLSGNNQPDYLEPFYGPLSPGGSFGSTLWFDEFTAIRNCNTYIDAVPKAPDLTAAQKSASIGFAQTIKALEFMYIISTRADLGAPVDVDRPPTATPAPFVSEDSVYATVIHTLDSARVSLTAAGAISFPFSLPPGYATYGFNAPSTFLQFNAALLAKAEIMRATDAVTGASAATGCAGNQPSCYQAALGALDSSFISLSAADFSIGTYFDYSTAAGDVINELSEPLNGPIYFSLFYADTVDSANAEKQSNGSFDQRVLNKIAAATQVQALAGFPLIGNYKFTVYFVGGLPSPNASIPVIRDEELILLRAEAELGLGMTTQAQSDIDFVRVNAGNLPPLGGPLSAPALLNELLYNRQYSLLWEQGTRWIDARRYGRLGNIPIAVAGGAVPTRMPIPTDECESRGLGSSCDPLGT
jgi:starch-binding outer membrane protein, SusD/RagB family